MKTIIINNEETDYLISETGEVYSKKTNKILTGTLYNTGYKMVRLTTKMGKKGYAIHRLVAETYIPNPNNLSVVNHKDGNKMNNNISNLEWVSHSENRKHAIKEQITNLATGSRNKIILNLDKDQWKQYNNTNYFISKKGEVYNIKTKILLKQTPNKSGYIRYTLRIDNKNITKLAHILVMETWSENYSSNMVINHLDGDKTNNDLSNLEICSKSENALHACYILNKMIKPVIQIFPDKTERHYSSISQAARELNITDSAIRYALKNNSKCCNSYWKYK